MKNTVAIVHGCGAHPRINDGRALGAGGFIEKNPGLIDTIVFSGGKTGGPNNPSEAEMMYQTFSRVYPDISNHIRIILEEESCDTRMSAEKSIRLLQVSVQDTVFFLLSQRFHLPRIMEIYGRLLPKGRFIPCDTDAYISLEMRDKIHSLLAYKRLVLQEPLSRILERSFLRDCKRLLTKRRLR